MTNKQVAPHTGAWIETPSYRVLKMNFLVAPHTGAWIETPALLAVWLRCVAPHTGAWIETLITSGGQR